MDSHAYASIHLVCDTEYIHRMLTTTILVFLTNATQIDKFDPEPKLSHFLQSSLDSNIIMPFLCWRWPVPSPKFIGSIKVKINTWFLRHSKALGFSRGQVRKRKSMIFKKC